MADEYVLFFDPGIINMAYCLVKIDTLKIIKWGLFSIKDSTNEGSCEKLAKYLDTTDILSIKNEGDTQPNVIIVIEQQPRCNIKTITISGQLQMYYVLQKMVGVFDKNICKIKKIVGYHAGNKIKYYVPKEGDEPLPDRLDKLKKGHYKTKQVLIEHCRRVLIHNDEKEWSIFFESQVKLDDFSDSMISSLSYIQTHKLRKV
jgi:hypothetical protein